METELQQVIVNGVAYQPTDDTAIKIEHQKQMAYRAIAMVLVTVGIMVCAIVALSGSSSKNIFDQDVIYTGKDVQCEYSTNGFSGNVCDDPRKICLLCQARKRITVQENGSIQEVSIPSFVIIVLCILLFILSCIMQCWNACK